MSRASGHCIDDLCHKCTYPPCDHHCHNDDEGDTQ